MSRLSSLDQFRGYTVLGMFVVNFVAGYRAVPRWLHFDHSYCSAHDTIMPQFFLAVGFAMRLTFARRTAADGATTAYRQAAKRSLFLMLLGVVLYHVTGQYARWAELTTAWQRDGGGAFLLQTIKRGPFETLTHIGLTSLFVLPVIAAPGWVRGLFAVGSAAAHVGLSFAGYYAWNLANPAGIDGGPLGFLTWTIPLIAGTLAHDWTTTPRGGLRPLLLSAVALMLVGYGLSCLNGFPARLPFVSGDPEPTLTYWTMSQRAGSVSYLTFATGFALAVLAGFRIACDGWGWNYSLFDLLGRNALAAYLIHGLVADAVKPLTPRDAPALYVWFAFVVYLFVTKVFVRVAAKLSQPGARARG